MADMCKIFVIVFLAAVYVVEIKSNGKVVDLSCNFDKDLCNWYQDENNDLNWTFNSGGNDSSSTGLPMDQVAGADHYIFIESNGTDDEQNVSLVSKTQSPGNYCMTFWYKIFGNYSTALIVFLLNNETLGQKELWNSTNDGTSSEVWLEVKLNIESHQYFKLKFSGIVSGGSDGYIAVNRLLFDSIWCGQGCCTFEHGACSWNIAYQWRRTTGHAESEKASPTFDHTLQSKDGHYVYMDKNGTIAVMESPQVLPGVYCLSFWYYMNDVGSMKLQVLLDQTGLDQTPELFSKSENQGDEWRHAEIQINSTHNFSLHFVGKRENNSGGGIAVDDIQISSDQCTTDTFPRTTTTYNPTQSSQGSGNGLLVAIAVATSCVAAIILAIFLFIIWRRTHGARNKQSTAVENKMYAFTNTIRFTNRSAVNDHLQCSNANSGTGVQDSSSNYIDIDLNYIPMNGKEADGHQKETKHSDNVDNLHSQCSKQNNSTENDNTYDRTNGINSKRMMKEKEDHKYDHIVTKINKEKSCTEYECLHLERTTEKKDSCMQAVACSEALGGKPESQKSFGPGDKDKTQDGQTEMEMLRDESHEYCILEKTGLQQS